MNYAHPLTNQEQFARVYAGWLWQWRQCCQPWWRAVKAMNLYSRNLNGHSTTTYSEEDWYIEKLIVCHCAYYMISVPLLFSSSLMISPYHVSWGLLHHHLLFNVLATLSLTTSIATPSKWKLAMSSPNWPSTFSKSVLLDKVVPPLCLYNSISSTVFQFFVQFGSSISEVFNRAVSTSACERSSLLSECLWKTTFPMIPHLCSY